MSERSPGGGMGGGSPGGEVRGGNPGGGRHSVLLTVGGALFTGGGCCCLTKRRISEVRVLFCSARDLIASIPCSILDARSE